MVSLAQMDFDSSFSLQAEADTVDYVPLNSCLGDFEKPADDIRRKSVELGMSDAGQLMRALSLGAAAGVDEISRRKSLNLDIAALPASSSAEIPCEKPEKLPPPPSPSAKRSAWRKRMMDKSAKFSSSFDGTTAPQDHHDSPDSLQAALRSLLQHAEQQDDSFRERRQSLEGRRSSSNDGVAPEYNPEDLSPLDHEDEVVVEAQPDQDNDAVPCLNKQIVQPLTGWHKSRRMHNRVVGAQLHATALVDSLRLLDLSDDETETETFMLPAQNSPPTANLANLRGMRFGHNRVMGSIIYQDAVHNLVEDDVVWKSFGLGRQIESRETAREASTRRQYITSDMDFDESKEDELESETEAAA